MSSETRIIGLTGGIGSGKSVVSRILRLNGYTVYDCDSEASHIMNQDESVREKLIDIMGIQCYQENGILNRCYVASKLFNDDSIRAKVNAVVHEAVKEELLNLVRKSPDDIVFCESAILATSGIDRQCYSIWIVDAPESLRIERVMARNGLSRKQVLERIRTQQNELNSLNAPSIEFIDNSGCQSVVAEVKALCKNTDIKNTSATFESEVFILNY